MELLELILFLLIAVVASSLLDQILRGVSLPLVQILLGALMALALPLPTEITIDAELLLILFIAPLHFNESRHVDSGQLYRNRFGIASLVTGLVLLTMVVVGNTLHALIPAIPLALALAFGAALGSTDAAAVTSLSKEMRFGSRHEAQLTGEALFNDVTGTICFQCALAVITTGAFSLTHAGEEFALELFGSFFVGMVLGLLFWATSHGLRRFGLENPTVHVVLELLAPFIIYLIAEQLHASGVVTVVMAGLVISLLPHKRTITTSQQRLQASSVWKTLEFVLNGIIFVVLGMQIPAFLVPAIQSGNTSALLLIGTALVITAVLELVRFFWILGLDLVHTKVDKRPLRICFSKRNLKGTLAMAFAGPKGGVTLALMLTIPVTLSSGDAFPMRQEILFLTSGVIVCTMLLANFAVQKLVPRKPSEKRSSAYADAEINLLMRVIDAIQEDAAQTGMVVEAKDALQNAGQRSSSRANTATDESTTASESAATIESSTSQDRNPEESQAKATKRKKTFKKPTTLADLELPEEVDEPATALVMKRYSDRMREFIPQASKPVAHKATLLADRIDVLYDQVDAYSEALAHVYDSDDNDAEGIEARILALQAIQNAVDDIQDAALTRELELIKQDQRAGKLSAEHARKLRNNVYIQQMTID